MSPRPSGAAAVRVRPAGRHALAALLVATLALVGCGLADGPPHDARAGDTQATRSSSQSPQEATGRAPRSAFDMSNFEKPSDRELRDMLTAKQYEVTQRDGTERPFDNAYWDNHEHGLYVDVVSGEPLFSSLDKFDSGSGWPSFTRPVAPDNIVGRSDSSWLMERNEVRSKHADSHLGHVFDDGPKPTGLRYCINSAALRFIPVERLAEEGYGDYLPAFAAAGVVPSTGRGGDGGGDETSGERALATLAGGCFWGVENLFRELDGVIDTEVGYTGGKTENPTYQEVCTGRTGHAEAIQITFDPRRVSYEEILRYFYRLHDPTTLNRQHNDIGPQYRSAIFVHDAEQRRVAERVTREVDASGVFGDPVVTEIVDASPFYPAEDYHQDYLVKNPGGYNCHVLRPESTPAH